MNRTVPLSGRGSALDQDSRLQRGLPADNATSPEGSSLPHTRGKLPPQHATTAITEASLFTPPREGRGQKAVSDHVSSPPPPPLPASNPPIP